MELILKITSMAFSIFCILYVFLKKFKKGKFNIIYMCYVLFFLVQVLPMFLKPFLDFDGLRKYVNIYKAINDYKTDIYYSIFIFITNILFMFFGKKLEKYANENSYNIKDSILNNKIFTNKYIKLFLFLGMFITIPFIFLAPNIKAYTSFLYFYKNEYSDVVLHSSDIWAYHINIMSRVNLISFVSIILYYLTNTKKRNNFSVILACILLAWISQKRTLILFVFIGILYIDIFIKEKRSTQKIVLKAIIFATIEIVYFIIYKNYTGKGLNNSFTWTYSLYFSRMMNVKLAIYDRINNCKMLDYPFQTLIWNVLWFVPRILWNSKPYPYDIYFTTYALGENQLFFTWNFQVNSFSEFISNAGFMRNIYLVVYNVFYCKKINRKEKFNDLFNRQYFFNALYYLWFWRDSQLCLRIMDNFCVTKKN